MDDRVVKLIGDRTVRLQDGASMTYVDAREALRSYESEVTASLGKGENIEMYQWKLDDKLAEILAQCPDLFNEYYMQAQDAAAAEAQQ